MAEDLLQDPQVRQWLGGIEPAWALLTVESLRALRRDPSAMQTAIRIANDLSAQEIAGSPVARNTLMHIVRQLAQASTLVRATRRCGGDEPDHGHRRLLRARRDRPRGRRAALEISSGTRNSNGSTNVEF